MSTTVQYRIRMRSRKAQKRLLRRYHKFILYLFCIAVHEWERLLVLFPARAMPRGAAAALLLRHVGQGHRESRTPNIPGGNSREFLKFWLKYGEFIGVLFFFPIFSEAMSSAVRPSVVCLSSVCRLSVNFVRPTQAIEIFGNVSNHLVRWPSADIQVKFYGDRHRFVRFVMYCIINWAPHWEGKTAPKSLPSRPSSTWPVSYILKRGYAYGWSLTLDGTLLKPQLHDDPQMLSESYNLIAAGDFNATLNRHLWSSAGSTYSKTTLYGYKPVSYVHFWCVIRVHQQVCMCARLATVYRLTIRSVTCATLVNTRIDTNR